MQNLFEEIKVPQEELENMVNEKLAQRIYADICSTGILEKPGKPGLPEKILVGRNYYSVVHCPSDSIESHSDELLFHVCDPVFRDAR